MSLGDTKYVALRSFFRDICLGSLLIILCGILFSSVTTWAKDGDDTEESALNSIEDLVSDLEKDLSEEERQRDLRDDSTDAHSTSGQKKTTSSTNTPSKSSHVSQKPKKNPPKSCKIDAVLLLTANKRSNIQLNGQRRGSLSANKARRFLICSGEVFIRLQAANGVVREFTKQIKTRSRIKVNVNMKRKRNKTP